MSGITLVNKYSIQHWSILRIFTERILEKKIKNVAQREMHLGRRLTHTLFLIKTAIDVWLYYGYHNTINHNKFDYAERTFLLSHSHMIQRSWTTTRRRLVKIIRALCDSPRGMYPIERYFFASKEMENVCYYTIFIGKKKE